MGKVKGEDVILSIRVGGSDVPIACARSITFDIQQDMIETSITQNGRFRTYVPGAASWSGTIEGLVFISKDNTPLYGLGHLYDDLINKTLLGLKWYEEDETGSTYLQKEGEAYIESINETSSFDNIVTFSANFKGSGAISITYGDI